MAEIQRGVIISSVVERVEHSAWWGKVPIQRMLNRQRFAGRLAIRDVAVDRFPSRPGYAPPLAPRMARLQRELQRCELVRNPDPRGPIVAKPARRRQSPARLVTGGE